VTPDVPDRLVGDWMRLQQVRINLVGNALKFTEQGRVVVTVDMEERTSVEALLHMTVADTGIGVPADRHAAIFEAFTQADGSTARSHGGTGLGLTISRRFVEMMGGRLWLESLPQRGSTFHLTVRLGVDAQPAEPSRASVPPRTPAAPMKILLAEDNRVNQFLTVRLLEKEGHRVEVVLNGRAALAALDQDQFDLALMDLQMPEMDGFETTAIIRERERASGTHLPIIALTANAMVGDAEKCLQAGMDGYVAKPVDVRRLFAEISRVQAGLQAQSRVTALTGDECEKTS
jgi:two-component system CheB/CheR fusion protein